MEYLHNLTKGSGKGKVGAIIGIASPISFTKMGIKNAGTVSMTIGIPCLAAGVATCIAGHIKNNTTIDTTDPTKAAEDAKAIAEKEESKGKMKEASYYLLSTGSALTIVGIPLHICGKRIMELNVNYTGNGAGLALKF